MEILQGIRWHGTNGAIYYRTDIFEAQDLKCHRLMKSLKQCAQKLKENGVTPLALAGSDAWDVMRMLELWVEMYAGPEEHDKLQSLSTSWDCDAVVKSL